MLTKCFVKISQLVQNLEWEGVGSGWHYEHRERRSQKLLLFSFLKEGKYDKKKRAQKQRAEERLICCLEVHRSNSLAHSLHYSKRSHVFCASDLSTSLQNLFNSALHERQTTFIRLSVTLHHYQ